MMDFSEALMEIKRGKKLAREGWNGKDMFVFLVKGSEFNVNRPPLSDIYELGTPISYCGHIDMKLADGRIMVWSPSQIDMLENDWFVKE